MKPMVKVRKPWTTQEIRLIKELLKKGFSDRQICDTLNERFSTGRTVHTVKAIKYRFKLKKNI